MTQESLATQTPVTGIHGLRRPVGPQLTAVALPRRLKAAGTPKGVRQRRKPVAPCLLGHVEPHLTTLAATARRPCRAVKGTIASMAARTAVGTGAPQRHVSHAKHIVVDGPNARPPASANAEPHGPRLATTRVRRQRPAPRRAASTRRHTHKRHATHITPYGPLLGEVAIGGVRRIIPPVQALSAGIWRPDAPPAALPRVLLPEHPQVTSVCKAPLGPTERTAPCTGRAVLLPRPRPRPPARHRIYSAATAWGPTVKGVDHLLLVPPSRYWC